MKTENETYIISGTCVCVCECAEPEKVSKCFTIRGRKYLTITEIDLKIYVYTNTIAT